MFLDVRGYTREVKSMGAFRRENGSALAGLHALYTNSTPTLQNQNKKFCQCSYNEKERKKGSVASFDRERELLGISNLGKPQASLEKGEAGRRFRRGWIGALEQSRALGGLALEPRTTLGGCGRISSGPATETRDRL